MQTTKVMDKAFFDNRLQAAARVFLSNHWAFCDKHVSMGEPAKTLQLLKLDTQFLKMFRQVVGPPVGRCLGMNFCMYGSTSSGTDRCTQLQTLIHKMFVRTLRICPTHCHFGPRAVVAACHVLELQSLESRSCFQFVGHATLEFSQHETWLVMFPPHPSRVVVRAQVGPGKSVQRAAVAWRQKVEHFGIYFLNGYPHPENLRFADTQSFWRCAGGSVARCHQFFFVYPTVLPQHSGDKMVELHFCATSRVNVFWPCFESCWFDYKMFIRSGLNSLKCLAGSQSRHMHR